MSSFRRNHRMWWTLCHKTKATSRDLRSSAAQIHGGAYWLESGFGMDFEMLGSRQNPKSLLVGLMVDWTALLGLTGWLGWVEIWQDQEKWCFPSHSDLEASQRKHHFFDWKRNSSTFISFDSFHQLSIVFSMQVYNLKMALDSWTVTTFSYQLEFAQDCTG